MDNKLFDEIGFSERERKVYLALLEVGTSTVGPVISRSGIPSSKIYETMEKLVAKGVVSFSIRDNKRYYSASNPKVLLNFMDEKRIKVENELIPRLEGLYGLSKTEKRATIYEEVAGIKTVYEKALAEMKKGDILYVLSSPSKSNILLGPYLDYFHERRIAKGVVMKILYNKEAKKYGEKRKKMKLTNVRYLPEKQAVMSAINMYLDYSLIFDYSKTPSVIQIKSASVTKNFVTYFDMLWKSAKK